MIDILSRVLMRLGVECILSRFDFRKSGPEMRKSDSILQLIVINLLLLVIFTACAPGRVQKELKTEVATTEEVTHVVQEIPMVYFSVGEITTKSDLIVIGRAIEQNEIINTARDPDDPLKPDPKYFSIGQIYTIQVDEYIKGNGPKSFHILQHRGFFVPEDGKSPSADELENALKGSGVELLDPLKSYIMFLRASDHSYEGYEKESLYVGVAHPWLFDLADSKCVKLEDSISALEGYFPSQPYEIMRMKINAAIDGKEFDSTNIYPPPYSEQLCPADAPLPYP